MPPFIANHLVCQAKIRGGLAVANPVLKEPGTIGFLGTSDGADRWLVSCYHVLCRRQGTRLPPGARESIVYAFDADAPPRVLGVVDPARCDDPLDCAAALLVNPADGIGQILGIGALNPQPITPRLAMRVLKSGIATGVTEGRISLVGADAVIHVETTDPRYEVCRPGDSGALWLDAETLRPVALHTGGLAGNERGVAVATAIDAVLRRTGLQLLIDPE